HALKTRLRGASKTRVMTSTLSAGAGPVLTPAAILGFLQGWLPNGHLSRFHGFAQLSRARYFSSLVSDRFQPMIAASNAPGRAIEPFILASRQIERAVRDLAANISSMAKHASRTASASLAAAPIEPAARLG